MNFLNEYQNYLKSQMENFAYFKNGASEAVSYLPQMIYIEPTNTCFLNCVFCARQKMSRPLKVMALEQFKSIIDKMAKESFHCPITLTGNGEPLLNKDILSMIAYAKQKDFNVSLISNSVLLGKDIAAQLVKLGLNRYQTSFDSVRKETYQAIRRNADFKKTLSNILYLVKANEEAGHPVYLSIVSVQCSFNKAEKEEVLSFWQALPVDNVYLSPLLSLQADSGLYQETVSSRAGQEYQVCSVPWITLSISSDGNVVACAVDFNNKYVLGNIFENSLPEIWNGPKIRKLRRALLDNDLTDFTALGHDCAKCNAPYVEDGNSLQGCLREIPKNTARHALYLLGQKKRAPAFSTESKKCQKLLELTARLNEGR